MKQDKKQIELDSQVQALQTSLNWLESNVTTRDDLDQINSALNYVIKIVQEIRSDRVFFSVQSKRKVRKLVK